MARNVKLRFRATAWPPDPIPVEDVAMASIEVDAPGLFRYVVRALDKAMPPEVALRIVPALDLDDDSVILEFMREYGPLTPYEGDGLCSVYKARERLLTIRAIVAHWEAHQTANERGIVAAWVDNGFDKPPTVGVAWDWWADALNGALEPFRAHVEVVSEDKHGSRHHGWDRPQVTSYAAMAAEVLNDIATGTEWRHCANEPCDKLFARQQGRAEFGQYRTRGVRFCSKGCAKAQMQRELRRRRAKSDNGGKSDG